MREQLSTRAEEFANNLNDIGMAIGDISQKGTLSAGQPLTHQQKDFLLNCQIQLLRSSAALRAQAITLDVDSVKDQLARLQEATGNIVQVLGRVNEVQKIMDIAGAAIAVVSSLVTGNILEVSGPLGKLLESISESKN
jgi:hypothetical protein